MERQPAGIMDIYHHYEIDNSPRRFIRSGTHQCICVRYGNTGRPEPGYDRRLGILFSLKGWYEFYPVGGDGLDIYLWIFGPKGIAGIAGSHVIEITGSKSVYTAFAMGIAMLPNTTGDSASVDIETAYGSSGTLHAGTYALFDDFVLDNSVTAVNDNEFAMPSTFSLVQNYPNPFNPTTQIEFTIPERNHVTLKVYNIMAQEVATLIDHNLDRGRYKTAFDGSRLASGMYLYKIQAGSFSQVKKMLLIK